jgi:transposase
MSIAEKINKFYKNSLIDIKNCHNRKEKRNLIKELIGNLIESEEKFSERCLSETLGVSRQLIHDILSEINIKKNYPILILIITFISCIFKTETRGRKKFEVTHPNILNDIEEICENTKHIDKSIKGEIYYTDITLSYIQKQLKEKYNYQDKDCPSTKTISRMMREKLGYKITKVKKDKVFKRVAETDNIFKNVFAKMKEMKNNVNIVAISIDDKVSKYIGNLSALGYSWLEKHALDHDTNPEYIAKPFGIMDIKEKIVHVFCTISNSTANFKVDCIEEFIIQKINYNNIEKLMIFLDNGPENSSRRKLWMKRIIELSIKYNIVIELVYYPPYHSKYNLIEHFWGVLQKHWSGLVIDTLDKLIGAINSTTWHGVNAIGYLRTKEYLKGEKVNDNELNELIDKHVSYSNLDIKKWSVIINP